MIRVRQVKVKLNSSDELIRKSIANKLKINVNEIISFKINKQSIDARDKENVHYICEYDVKLKNEEKVLKYKSNDILLTPDEKYIFNVTGNKELKYRPVIVGSGPAGLYAAYMLAKHGYRPLIIERGEQVENRVETVKEFWNTGKLNKNSNVQFGEGGAGTFSDGKLNTLVKDSFNRNKKVLEIFYECGAPEEILYINKPHIGTDLLVEVVKNLREKIISFGGEFRFNTCLTDLIITDGKLEGIIVNNSERIDTEVLVLAIGHSARDTFRMLENKLDMSAKPFAVGVRVQHNQDMINVSQYGEKSAEMLPSASYKLTYRTKEGRGVYTFCMCPGGFVVNSSSENNRLAINGMSNFARDEKNANSAVIVTISPEDFGCKVLDGLKYQEWLETLTYLKGNGNIPIQLLKDFKENRKSEKFESVSPVMKGKFEFANLREILPDYITNSLIEAFEDFDKKIKGFGNGDSILAAIESRTSSPIKIHRNEDGISSVEGIYPCGEGAGFAGGITSSAMDGLKIAECIAKKYKSFN